MIDSCQMTTPNKETIDILKLFITPQRCAICGMVFEHGMQFIRLMPTEVQMFNPPEGWEPGVVNIHRTCFEKVVWH